MAKQYTSKRTQRHSRCRQHAATRATVERFEAEVREQLKRDDERSTQRKREEK